MSKAPLFQSRPWRFSRTLLREAQELSVSDLSASISFYALLSLAPLVLMSAFILGLWLDPEEVRMYLLEELSAWGDIPQGLFNLNFSDLIFPESFRNWGLVIASASFLWGTGLVFFAILDSLKRIWRFEPKHSEWMWWLWGVLFSAMMSVLFVFSIVFRIYLRHTDWLGQSAGIMSVDLLTLFLIIVSTFFLMFRAYSRKKLSRMWALTAASGLGILILAGKELIAWLLSQSLVLGAYGLIGSILLFLLWIYYSAQILLWGNLLIRLLLARRSS